MASRRPTVRTTTEFRLPSPYPDPADWMSTMVKAGADAGAQFTRQWMQWWLDAPGRVVQTWWRAFLPPR